MDTSHPQDDYSTRFFIFNEWFAARGPLTAQNVLDYFAISMFYDKQSTNQVLRMQTEFTGMPVENEAEELRRFTGIEFAVVHEQAPNFFVIQKRERLSPDEVRPISMYFIMYNRIYQAPDVYSVASNRLLATLNCLQNSLQLLSSRRPDFTPRMGFLWPIVPQKSAKETDSSGLKPPDATSIREKFVETNLTRPLGKKQENHTLLYNAMRTTAIQTRQIPTFDTQISGLSSSDMPRESSRTSETPGPNLGQDDEQPKLPLKKKRKRSVVPP